MLLKIVDHQQLTASSWGLAVQLGRALPGHCPWGLRPSCTASPGAPEGARTRGSPQLPSSSKPFSLSGRSGAGRAPAVLEGPPRGSAGLAQPSTMGSRFTTPPPAVGRFRGGWGAVGEHHRGVKRWKLVILWAHFWAAPPPAVGRVDPKPAFSFHSGSTRRSRSRANEGGVL